MTAMKIWPFDEVARANGGQIISATTCDAASNRSRRSGPPPGTGWTIMVELHGLWDAVPAIKICRALAEFRPYWVEDAIKLDSEDALAACGGPRRSAFAFGETLAGVHAYKRLFDSGAVDVVMFDFGWGGGISESRRVSRRWRRLTGFRSPLTTASGRSPSPSERISRSAAKNALIQETVRAYYTDWYREIVVGLPSIERGHISPPPTRV